MSSLNKCSFIGHLGRDVELRYLPSGEAVANFSIACSEKWKDKQTGEMREETEWVRISFFGKLAEVAGQYLHKGSLVYVDGKMKTRKYTDKDGVEKTSTEIKGETLKMLGGKGNSEGGQAPRQQGSAPRQASQQRQAAPQSNGGGKGSGFDDMDDDIPW